jgi:hypothetical protein
MTEFDLKLRHRCRNRQCQAKLPAPVTNEREAFCCDACFNSFYRHRCLICQREMERKTENQKVCGRRKCRNALAAKAVQTRFLTKDTLKPDSGSNSPLRSKAKSATKSDQASVSPCLPEGLAKPGHGQPGWHSERMLAADGSERDDDDWRLLDRQGRMLARVRQEGFGYWVARPRAIPESAVESFNDACRRAVTAAVATLEPWPATERDPLHPGMTPSQFDATRRNLHHKHPDWSAKQITDYITDILKLAAKAASDTDAIVSLAEYRQRQAHVGIDRSLSATISDDLSIPSFLRRTFPPKKKKAA